MRFFKRLLVLLAFVVLVYAGYKLYADVFTNYIENHPAGQEHRPDVFAP